MTHSTVQYCTVRTVPKTLNLSSSESTSQTSPEMTTRVRTIQYKIPSFEKACKSALLFPSNRGESIEAKEVDETFREDEEEDGFVFTPSSIP